MTPDGNVEIHQLPTYQRWDGEWRPTASLNRTTGDWPYLLEESSATIGATRLNAMFQQAKIPGAVYEFQPWTIKETIVMAGPPPAPRISVPLVATSLTVSIVNRTCVLSDEAGSPMWIAGGFHAWDSSAEPRMWEEAVSSLDYSNGILNLTLDSKMLADAVFPLYVDPTWTLSATAGWGSSVFQNAVEDKGDHNVRIGWFADNFNDNTNEGQWTTESGAVTFSTGVMQLSQSSTVRGGSLGSPWTDLRESFTVRFTVSGGMALAIFRFSSGTDYYWLEISEPGDSLTLKKKVFGVTSTIGLATGVPIVKNTDYAVKIVATGNTFEIWWQGVVKMNPTDNSPPPTPASGPIKFATDSIAKAKIDNVRLWNTTSGTITSGVRDAGATNRPLLERIMYTGGLFQWADSQILSSADNVVWSDAHYVKVGPKSALDYSIAEGDQNRYYKVRVELRSTDDGTPSLSEITTTEGIPTTPAPSVVLGYEHWQYYVGGLAHVVDGNLFLSETDFGLPGKGFSIEFRRAYNSLQTYSGTVGLGWTHNYNVSLSGSTDVAMYDGDGSRHIYTSLGSNLYSSPPGLSASKLTKNGDATYSLFWPDGKRLNFTSAGRLSLITDRNGNKLTLTYDGSNRLQKVQDDSGLFLEFLYDGNGRISTVRDHTLRGWTFSYASNRLTQVTDPRSNSTLYLYDASNRIEKVVDRANKMTRIAYDASSRVTDLWLGLYNRTTSSITWQYRWYTISGYANARSRTVTDANGVASTFTLDERGTPKNITGPMAGGSQTCCGRAGSESVEGQWDGERNKVVAKDGKGYTWRFTHDYRGNDLTRLDPMGNTSSSTWDNRDTGVLFVSLRTRVTNFRGYSTMYTYDGKGNLVTITNALGASKSMTYDASGFLKTSTDFRGYQTNYTIDAHGWPTEVKNPLGHVTKSGYDNLGRRVNVTTPLGSKTLFEYDSLDRQTKVTDPLGNFTRFEYNARGDLTKTTDPSGYTTTQVINVTVRRPSKAIEPGGNFSLYGYDTRGNLISVTNARGFTTTYQYDAYSRMINETKPGGNYTRLAYDRNGNVVIRTDPNGNVTAYLHDKLDRVTKITYPGSNIATFEYDANGNAKQVTGNGYTRTATFDALDRSVSGTDNYGSFSKTFDYQYGADSRRTRMNYSDGSFVTYAYDKAGWLTYENHSDGSSWSFGYDNDGRRTTVTNPNGAVSTTKYDKASRVTNVWTNRSGSVLESFAYKHDKAGNRVNMTEMDGSWAKYAYDNLYRLSNESYSGGRSIGYTYDANGNRLTSRDMKVGVPLLVTNYLYGKDDQLLQATGDFITTYTYDKNGNRLTMTVGGATARYAYDSENRLVSVKPVKRFSASLASSSCAGTSCEAYTGFANPSGFDPSSQSVVVYLHARGGVVAQNMHAVTISWYYIKNGGTPVLMGSQTYRTDAEVDVTKGSTITLAQGDTIQGKLTWNQDQDSGFVLDALTLTYFAKVTPTDFGYSGDSRRMSRTSGASTTYFGNDPVSPSGYDDTIEEYTSTGTTTATYLHGIGADEPLGFKTTAWSSYHRDALGSVTRLTDSSGVTNSTYRYDAFGAIRSQTGPGNTYGFTSRENEAGPGLYYNRARYYDPAGGRFLSADPTGLGGGMNRYGYAGGNPVNRIDPSGALIIWDPGGGGSSGVGADYGVGSTGGQSLATGSGTASSGQCTLLWVLLMLSIAASVVGIGVGAAMVVSHETMYTALVGIAVVKMFFYYMPGFALAISSGNIGRALSILGTLLLAFFSAYLAKIGFWAGLGLAAKFAGGALLLIQLGLAVASTLWQVFGPGGLQASGCV